MAKVDVTTEIDIARPLHEVASYAADPDNVPQWYSNIKSVEWKTIPPLELGSQVAFVAYFLRRRLAYTFEVVDYIPHQRIVMRTSEGPFPMETSYHWHALDGATTHMSLRNRGEPTGFSRIMAPFLTTMVRRANRQDLACLKKILESRPAADNQP